MSDVDENEGVQSESVEKTDGSHPVNSPYSGMDKSMSWIKGGAILVGALGLGSLGVGGLAIMHHLNDDGSNVTATAPSSSSTPSENPVPRSGTSSPRSSASSTSSAPSTPSASSSSVAPSGSSSGSVSASPSESSTPRTSSSQPTSIPSPSSTTQIPVPTPSGTSSTPSYSGSGPTTTTVPGPGGLNHDVREYVQRGRRSDSYHIQPGDTLSQLAEAFGRPMSELVARNRIVNPDLIYSGDWLLIPHTR